MRRKQNGESEFKEVTNFDNAATTFPKPQEVRQAVNDAIRFYGGNAGRGGHPLAMRTSEAVYSARETVASFFGAEPENTVFTLNCTMALNTAIKGVMSGGGHLIVSGLEHNSVSRPAKALEDEGKITLSVAAVYDSDEQTVESFRSLINPETRAVVCMAASNVTGRLMPIQEIAKICNEKNICFIVDGAQACGIVDIKLSMGINIICTSGHKGLYGITGTGLLISDGKYKIKPLIEGGTGSSSSSLLQPDFLPDGLESGTVNIIGVMSLKAGIEFIKKIGIEKIHFYEEMLCRKFIDGISSNNVIVYRRNNLRYAPIVSFNIKGMLAETVAEILGKKGFCLRAGYHCAALAHEYLGTENGTVRFAPSIFNNEKDVFALAKEVRQLAVKI